jgi:hypothetical protein
MAPAHVDHRVVHGGPLEGIRGIVSTTRRRPPWQDGQGLRLRRWRRRAGSTSPPDLRALYRWHDGIGTNSTVGLLAGQRVLPLDEAGRERARVGQRVASAPARERAASYVLAGHRTGGVQILDDGAGGGYFYDPNRSDAESAFFYHFAEMRYYV